MRIPDLFTGFVVLLLALFVAGCLARYPGHDIRQEIDGLLADLPAQGGAVDFGEIEAVAWDTMYIFRPFTPHDTIETALGYKWEQIAQIDLQRKEDIHLLVFAKDARVVASLTLPRGRIDFDLPAEYQRSTPTTALFQVQPVPGSRVLRLSPRTP